MAREHMNPCGGVQQGIGRAGNAGRAIQLAVVGVLGQVSGSGAVHHQHASQQQPVPAPVAVDSGCSLRME